MTRSKRSRVRYRMGRASLRPLLLVFLACLWTGNATLDCRPANGEVRIGRVSKLSDAEVDAQAATFLKFLEEKVPGFRFRIVHLRSDGEAIDAALKGNVDFLYVTPSVFVQLEVRSGAMVIATAKRIHGPGTVLQYVGGAILCRSDRHDIERVADLRGKRVVGLNPLALGGWISAVREFDDEGLDPESDFSELRFGRDPEEVAAAVANGQADAGVVSISELPQLMGTGHFSKEQFRVLPPRLPYPELRGLPVAASTRLYPGTAFVRMPHVDDHLAERVASALFDMPENGQVAASMLVAAWTLPANYQPVHECLRQLRLAPYEEFGKITLWGAVGQHWQSVTLSLVVLLGALMVAMISALRLNRKLLGSQSALKGELEQRKEAERAVLYQAGLLAHTRDAVVAADTQYRVTFWNEAAERLYAIPSGEALGRRIEELVPWFSSELPRDEIRKRVESGEGWSGEISFTRRGGPTVFADVAISRIEDRDGRLLGSIAGVRDITERKRLEEQLLQSQKMQAIGVLAGGVAHDFNNLLTVINGYTQLAMHEGGENATRECLSEVLNAGTRAAELTQQLLAFGRKQVLRPQILDLNALVTDTERLLRRLIGEDIELVLELDPAAGSIKADPGQMQTVIMNLAVNARDAMPKGGRLTLRTSTAEFEPNGERAEVIPGRYALFAVEDNGTGMDELTRSRIFEPFFTTKEMGKGTGLGLSTVYGIVKQSEGHIWVQTEIGKGSKFTVCLPAITTAAESKGTPAEQPITAAGRGKLLIVEDQREVRDLACRILQASGYDVLQAANGAEALQAVEESTDSLDLLLTDVVMPGMTGPELAARLKSRHPGLKVLFMSGYSSPNSAGEAIPGTEAEYIQKPFPPALLTRKVREILSPAGRP